MAHMMDWLLGLVRGRHAAPPEPESALAPLPHRSPLAAGNNAFAVALHRQLVAASENLFFSPLSIRTALAMVFVGARGPTADELRAALHFPSDDTALHASFKAFLDQLARGAGDEYTLHVANALWTQDGSPLEAAFLDLVTRCYDGGARQVDFRRAAREAEEIINRWVEEQTRDRIRDLIPPGALNADSRLVLTNAVYFKGKWTLPFEEADTRDEPFYLPGGKKAPVPLMNQIGHVDYMRGDGFRAVDLLYRGADLSMLVLLPDRKDGLLDLEARLTPTLLDDCVARMCQRYVDLSLPRFTLTWGTTEISGILRALGIARAFGEEADFSGINGRVPPDPASFYISLVFHKAFVNVNEEGTEAAAATAIVVTISDMPVRAMPIPVFRADHPFLFAIRHRPSGTILFLGRVTNPPRGPGATA